MGHSAAGNYGFVLKLCAFEHLSFLNVLYSSPKEDKGGIKWDDVQEA